MGRVYILVGEKERRWPATPSYDEGERRIRARGKVRSEKEFTRCCIFKICRWDEK